MTEMEIVNAESRILGLHLRDARRPCWSAKQWKMAHKGALGIFTSMPESPSEKINCGFPRVWVVNRLVKSQVKSIYLTSVVPSVKQLVSMEADGVPTS